MDLPIDHDSVSSLIGELLSFLNVNTDEISICFVEESEICTLHKTYFNDPSPTDCITFPIDFANHDDLNPGYHCLGEIIICPKTAMIQCETYGTDAYTELTLYLIHGILHLLGYNDIEEEERREMKKAEAKCLAWAEKHQSMIKPKTPAGAL